MLWKRRERTKSKIRRMQPLPHTRASIRQRWNCRRALRHGDRPQGRRGPRIREEDTENAACREIGLAFRRAKEIR